MVKNVAAARTGLASVPDADSLESAPTSSAARAVVETEYAPRERMNAATSAGEPGFRNLKRGVMNDVPCVRDVVNVFASICRPYLLSGRRVQPWPLKRG